MPRTAEQIRAQLDDDNPCLPSRVIDALAEAGWIRDADAIDPDRYIQMIQVIDGVCEDRLIERLREINPRLRDGRPPNCS